MSEQWNASAILDGLERDGTARLVVGAPGAGKTDFALAVLQAGLRRYGSADAVMAVSGRVTADALGNRVIRHIGFSGQARPVTTLGAVAFRAIAAARRAEGLALPKLLNGAEQDALLRRVMATHVRHARVGDDCRTCALLRHYFAQSDWVGLVHDADASASRFSVGPGAGEGGATSADMFERGVSDAFIGQLRDMLARLDELGVSSEQEAGLIADVAADARLTVQWGLAFALRREYIAIQGLAYPGQYRLDASYLLVAGARAVRAAIERDGRDMRPSALDLPRLLVIDDVQDATLAGLRFVEALDEAGVRLVLVGNPDEAVQTFRGSYPEYLMRQAVTGSLHAIELPLGACAALVDGVADDIAEDGDTVTEPGGTDETDEKEAASGSGAMIGAARIMASRVSLSIASPEEEPLPLARRPGKLVEALRAGRIGGEGRRSGGEVDGCAYAVDGSLNAGLYRSPREELDDTVWRIKHAHLDHRVRWNDMAVIAHDNATVRQYGERLRRDGVPVRYSSITRPLKDESLVRGLFALVELAELRREGVSGCRLGLGAVATYVRGRVAEIMGGPLIGTGARPGSGMPARLASVESAMDAIESLAGIAGSGTAVDNLVAAWATMCETYRETHCETGCETSLDESRQSTEASLAGGERPSRSLHDGGDGAVRDGSHITVDDSLIGGDGTPFEKAPAFGSDALYVLLVFDEETVAPADVVVDAVRSVLGKDPQARAFANLWSMVSEIACKLGRLPAEQRRQPRYALSVAWDATGVASAWQRMALDNTADGRAANDRLDAAMRLFQFAEDSTASRDIMGFMAQVRGMEVQADSLAHVGPVEDALTLTTPAGASGRHWKYVWLPAVQQDVWPNLAGRNALFGGEDLADLVLHGGIDHGAMDGHDPRLASVLSSEKKSFLVALTRASCEVSVSAVWNDDLTPSDFLFGYLPERYPRSKAQARYTSVGGGEETRYDLAGLDADPRGLVAAARVALATADAGSAEAEDAVAALALLARSGVSAADPDDWSFARSAVENDDDGMTGKTGISGALEGETGTPDDMTGAVVDDTVNGSAGYTLNDALGDAANNDAAAVGSRSITQSVTDGTGDVGARDSEAGHDRGDAGHAGEPLPVAALSPSAVDSLWACPVCWMLENRFAGPRPGSVATAFGTLIHAVAQQGSEEGLDRLNSDPERMQSLGLDASATSVQRIDAVTARLRTIYESKRTDPNTITDTRDRYAAIRKDDAAADMLSNIAGYFVASDGDAGAYLGRNAEAIELGRLEHVECEREFAARFNLDDILAAYNGLEGMQPVSRSILMACMGTLVGGWPEGMDEHLTIRLSGRIDRMETRILADGSESVRLIDYKTGKVPSIKQIFNDLQLVCYQLGLAFPEGRMRGAAALAAMPPIGQSELFHVGQNGAPAQSYAPEGIFQPPLFTHGTLNAEPFTPRFHYKDAGAFLDMPTPDPDNPPEGVEAGDWRRFSALAGTQTMWALTMIARVFYAGAASRSATITAHPQPTHVASCRMKQSCPACAGQVDTIFETRQA